MCNGGGPDLFDCTAQPGEEYILTAPVTDSITITFTGDCGHTFHGMREIELWGYVV